MEINLLLFSGVGDYVAAISLVIVTAWVMYLGFKIGVLEDKVKRYEERCESQNRTIERLRESYQDGCSRHIEG